jgi:hypothetical protein
VNRQGTVVLLVTGREIKSACTPGDRGIVSVAANLDDVERALAEGR